MVDSLLRIFTQDVLKLTSRALLIDWMSASRSGMDRVRAGLPKSWGAGDKTGSGANGAINDLVHRLSTGPAAYLHRGVHE